MSLVAVRTLGGPPPWTLARPVSLEGAGLHSGVAARLTLAPASPGWWLVGRDGYRQRIERARLFDTTRCTALELGDGTRFTTVEHVLAAISGLGLDGVSLTLEGGREVPALDGSAAVFCAALLRAGLRRRPARARQQVLVLRRPLEVRDASDPEAWLRLSPVTPRRRSGRVPGALGREVVCQVHFEALPAAMPQRACWSDHEEGFAEAVAPARTFAFASWLASLWRNGLAQGGTADNALVFDDVDEPGALLSPSPLRMPDEPARHKLLDLLGDLARLGRPLVARIEAHRPGHRLNARLVDTLLGRAS